MTHTFTPTPIALPDGLMSWARGQSPAMWHEIACGIDFAGQTAAIDLLLTTQWITRQKNCCRATALMLLARMVAAGLHDAPAEHIAPEAAMALTAQIHDALANGRFGTAQFRLTGPQMALVQGALGPSGILPLPPAALTCGTAQPHAPFAFLGHRPVEAMPALPLVA